MNEEVASEKGKKLTAPYLPYKTFRTYIEGLEVGIPGRIDRSVMEKRSGVVQGMLVGALRYFDLIHPDGTPTERLPKLVEAKETDRQAILRDLLERAYPFLFGGSIKLDNATPKQVEEAFAGAGVSGDTLRKAVVFFLKAAKDANVPLSKHLKTREVKSAGRRRSSTRIGDNDENVPSGVTGGMAATKQKTEYQVLFEMLDPDKMEKEEQEAVWTLIRYLKKKGG